MEEDLQSEAQLRWERERIDRVKGGDRQAFAELYRAFAPRLYRRTLLPRLGDPRAAEDALSETFRTAIEKIDSFEPRVSVYFWLQRIAINKATDMHRVKSRTGRALASFEGLLAPLREQAPAAAADLEEREELARVRASVAAVLGKINPRYRRAIELRFLEERGREECAERMEVKLGTFDVLLLRALRAFRKEWTQSVGEPGAAAEAGA